MDYQLSITLKGDYLHVQVTGKGTYENALQMWRQLVEACELHQCYKILGEQNLSDSLTTMEAFDHPRIFKEVGITRKHRFAWVDHNPRTRATTAFIRDVHANRSIGKGRLFNDLEQAKCWLLGSDS